MSGSSDPNLIFQGIAWSAQIIGLLSAWRQEQQVRKGEHFQSFIKWLENHNFNELRERIYESDELNRELHALLSESLESIDAKIDQLTSMVAEVSSRIEGLSSIDRVISVEHGGLSTQAREILKLFESTPGADFMIVGEMGVGSKVSILFMPCRTCFEMDEPRFVDDDVAALEGGTLIRFDKWMKTGNPRYILTREGARLAQTLPAVVINYPEGTGPSSSETPHPPASGTAPPPGE